MPALTAPHQQLNLQSGYHSQTSSRERKEKGAGQERSIYLDVSTPPAGLGFTSCLSDSPQSNQNVATLTFITLPAKWLPQSKQPCHLQQTQAPFMQAPGNDNADTIISST